MDGLARITSAKEEQKKRAREGLMKILGRDANEIAKDVSEANEKLAKHESKTKGKDVEAEE